MNDERQRTGHSREFEGLSQVCLCANLCHTWNNFALSLIVMGSNVASSEVMMWPWPHDVMPDACVGPGLIDTEVWDISRSL